ncbi:hypothetical protein ES703_97884 [subsurface metagenome]
MSIREQCSMCREFTSDEDSDCIFRLMKDSWGYCQDWDEVFVICERCFSGVIMGGTAGALRDLTAAYNRRDWREMILIARSTRVSDPGGG